VGKITVDREKCKGCGYCVVFCPTKNIVISARLNQRGAYPAEYKGKEDKDCKACTFCALMCPEAAIEVYR